MKGSHQTDTEERITEEAHQEILEVKLHIPTAVGSYQVKAGLRKTVGSSRLSFS